MPAKVFSVRLSPKVNSIVADYMQEHHIKTKSKAINAVIENSKSKQYTQDDYFQYPPFLKCPIAKTWVLKETLFADEGCKVCTEKKDCPAWREILFTHKGQEKSSLNPRFKLPQKYNRPYIARHQHQQGGP